MALFRISEVVRELKNQFLKRSIACITAGILAVGVLAGCSGVKPTVKNEPIASRMSFALNTEIEIKIYSIVKSKEKSVDCEEVLTDCLTLCNAYEQKFSRTVENSEISILNRDSENDVSRETLELLSKGLYYSDVSNGKFDITIEPVSSQWDFTSGENVLPDADLIKSQLQYVDYSKVKISDQHVSVDPGMGIDLGAIAKGYIADCLKSYLVEQGVDSATISLGGNILCIGKKPSGDDFCIGIRDPQNTAGVKAAVYVDGKSVVTSGTYERFIEVDGKRYHHILDPETGYSCENDLDSVTIISDESVDGDCLSTTCFLLGEEKALELIDGMDGIWAMFIEKDGDTVYSEGFAENVPYKEY